MGLKKAPINEGCTPGSLVSDGRCICALEEIQNQRICVGIYGPGPRVRLPILTVLSRCNVEQESCYLYRRHLLWGRGDDRVGDIDFFLARSSCPLGRKLISKLLVHIRFVTQRPELGRQGGEANPSYSRGFRFALTGMAQGIELA